MIPSSIVRRYRCSGKYCLRVKVTCDLWCGLYDILQSRVQHVGQMYMVSRGGDIDAWGKKDVQVWFMKTMSDEKILLKRCGNSAEVKERRRVLCLYEWLARPVFMPVRGWSRGVRGYLKNFFNVMSFFSWNARGCSYKIPLCYSRGKWCCDSPIDGHWWSGCFLSKKSSFSSWQKERPFGKVLILWLCVEIKTNATWSLKS